MDQGNTYYSHPIREGRNVQPQEFSKKFREFIRTFHHQEEFKYREQLRNDHVIDLDLEDLANYDENLFAALKDEPGLFLPMFEMAAKEVLHQIVVPKPDSIDDLPDIQIKIKSTAHPTALRLLTAQHISKLVEVPGIIVSASKTRPKAHKIAAICRHCNHIKMIPVRPGLGGAVLPRTCEGSNDVTAPGAEKCPLDSYQIHPSRCEYIDHQTLKLQELAENVPTSEMPRHIILSCDRLLVENAVPGMRVTVVGVYSIFQNNTAKNSGVAIRNPYIRVLGMKADAGGAGRRQQKLDPKDEEEFRRLSHAPNIYNSIAKSIAPSIFGHEDIKKAVACLLAGGSHKQLPDGMKLRGDVNVLLLGDPSTAKSQMLKFAEKVAPICVYTSGKGSSAAGLTASVVRDPGTGEFYLEGGAMVLADGGVVCIDEFDKMREEDRVAIHEAMEQQTISIAKAGITTILNSRTSVLAAANPQFGRYDDMKTAVENIDFQSTILSRFDLIFVVKDVRDEERDITIAKHVLGLHANSANVQQVEGEMDVTKLRKYFAFIRQHCNPRLSEEAAAALKNHFVKIRQEARSREGRQAIPITIRQLEAIVRLSESIAKMSLSDVADLHHVNEALRLFQVSTLNAASSGIAMETTSAELINEVKKGEAWLNARIAVGTSVPERKLIAEMQRDANLSDAAIRKTLNVMLMRQEIEFRANGKLISRKR